MNEQLLKKPDADVLCARRKLYSTASDPQPQMIPKNGPQMILDGK